MPAVATTAKTSVPSGRAAMAARTSSPRSRRSSPVVASRTSTSMTRAAESIEECAPSEATTAHLTGRPEPSASRRRIASSRAAMRADRFPMVPPEAKQPPAPSGRPTRSATQRSAWFSAYTVPAASNQEVAHIADAPTTRSNRTEAFVGAPGTKERNRGWSVDRHAGARWSVKAASADSPPMPSSVMVCPTASQSSWWDRGPSRGGSVFTRSRA